MADAVPGPTASSAATLTLPPGTYVVHGTVLVVNSSAFNFGMTCAISVPGSLTPLATTDLVMGAAFADALGAMQNGITSVSLQGTATYPSGTTLTLRCRTPAELETDMTLQSARLIALQVGTVTH